MEDVPSDSSAVFSSDAGGAQTPSASPGASGEEGRRARRLSGKKRMAAQFPLPELEPGVKEQLMVQDWQLPDFALQDVPFSAPVNLSPRATFDIEAYTHPKDFASVYRLVHASEGQMVQNSAENEGFVRITNTRSRNINELQTEDVTSGKPSIPRKLTIDRSCSTKDLEEEKGPSDIAFLQSCFTTVSAEDLSDILQQCGGEVQWAANILLDAGYEYNEKPIVREPPPVHREAPATDTLGLIDRSISSSSSNSGPVSLVEICHQALEPDRAAAEEVQDRMVENSVRRLGSISEFHRQRSLSGDKDLKLKTIEKQQNMSSLDVFDDDSELDVFYSPVEGPVNPPFLPSTEKSPIHGISEIPLTDEAKAQQAQRQPLANDMVLTLSPALADQLIALFGPVGFHISSGNIIGHYFKV